MPHDEFMARKEYLVDMSDPDRDPVGPGNREEVFGGKGNLFSSELKGWPYIQGGKQMHAPTLDIDHHCHLVPSTTEGHFHLYIDVPMTWANYQLLLTVMEKVGILQPGFTRLSIAREASYVRKPGVLKGEGEVDS